MIALPLSILALAAGVYLLIKVNREYLGGIFKIFAWLVIVLSLVATAAVIRHGIHHHFKMRHQHFMHHEMQEPGMYHDMHCCAPAGDSICMMPGCKMMGDSIVLDRAVCEKMMGKESCEKLCTERGRCIMTKDECAKMCSGMGSGGDMKECCKGSGKEMPACCKGVGKETKSCCKK